MTTPKIYGIKNCDTIKKALKWLDGKNIAYDFHDYKKQGVDTSALVAAIETHGWENVINRRGTSWRKLPDDIKESMDAKNAISYALENPSLIKRPLLSHNDNTYLGFKEEHYETLFKT